jgi:hypothetical protein
MAERQKGGDKEAGDGGDADAQGMPENTGFERKVIDQQFSFYILVRDELFKVYLGLKFFAEFSIISGISMEGMEPVGDIFHTLQYVPQTDQAFHILC